MSRLILPGGSDPKTAIAAVLTRHNAAINSMTPAQREAVNRLVLATLAANHMVGDAPAEVQRGAAMAALEEVIRREANGEAVQAVMWTKNDTVDPQSDAVDRLARSTLESRQ